MKTRIQILALSALIVGSGCAFAADTAGAPPVPAANKPNILLILTDDLGYGDVQCLNPELGKIKTPSLDKLASQGMVFTDAHSGSAVCSPSRYGILTGRYAWRTRLQKYVLYMTDGPLIAPKRLTLPKFLQAQGYRTAGVGKWHLGQTIPKKDGIVLFDQPIKNGPLTTGFDSYFCVDYRMFPPFMFLEGDRFTGEALADNTKAWSNYKAAGLQFDDFAHTLPTTCDEAIKKLGELAGGKQPFFMYLAPLAPHNPFVPTEEWKGKSGLGAYADYVMETDYEIGRVLTALEKTGQADNTLVIFASDNGCAPYSGREQHSGSGYAEYLGVPEMEAKGHYPSAGRRGYKSDIFEGGHRVPFMVRWPGKVKAGAKNAETICLNDVMATCAEILGEKLPDNSAEDSVSLLPMLRGQSQPPRHEAIVHHSIDGYFAIRQGKWKLEFCPGSGGWSAPKPFSKEAEGLPPVQLYDLVADPGEKTNVQAENPEVVKQLTALMEKYIADGRSTPGEPQQNDFKIDYLKTAPPAARAKKEAPANSAPPAAPAKNEASDN